MWSRVVYMKDRRRKPVLTAHGYGAADAQGAIPAGWCVRCGAEVYRAGELLCRRCEKEEAKENA